MHTAAAAMTQVGQTKNRTQQRGKIECEARLRLGHLADAQQRCGEVFAQRVLEEGVHRHVEALRIADTLQGGAHAVDGCRAAPRLSGNRRADQQCASSGGSCCHSEKLPQRGAAGAGLAT